MRARGVDVDQYASALSQPPTGWPSYDDPDVQAVAVELLGDPLDSGYWAKPVETNPATALHAAVRAVRVIRERVPDA